MLAKPFRFFSLLSILKKVSLFFVVLSLVLASISALYLLRAKDQTVIANNEVSELLNASEVKEAKEFSFDAIKLDKDFATLFERDLNSDLSFLGKNSRPDALSRNSKALIQLKESDEQRIVEEGEKVYFRYKEGALSFSEVATPLWVKVKGIGNSLFLDSKVVVASEESEQVFQESAKLELVKRNYVPSQDAIPYYFESLSSATWLVPDKFFQLYGGADYQDKKGAYRLKLTPGGSFCFVKDQDLLYYNGKDWLLAKENQDVSNYPIAEVKINSQSRLALRVWDKSGMLERLHTFSCDKLPAFNLRVDEIFSKIRPRSKSQVTCKVAGKTAMLKNGDWLLKKENHWKLLRTYDEIQRYLQYELEGELFVFDQIEKNESNPIFKGHLFDTMRTQMQVVRIPIALSNKDHSKKKNKLLKKVTPASEDFTDTDDFDDYEEDDEELLRLTGEGAHHEIEK
ncbi:MAG: hypothetical protein S4CHLAM37_00890 [Chlamydiia bacterium]|nr:hypothetical protein [Chlamydiia bacterium]